MNYQTVIQQGERPSGETGTGYVVHKTLIAMILPMFLSACALTESNNSIEKLNEGLYVPVPLSQRSSEGSAKPLEKDKLNDKDQVTSPYSAEPNETQFSYTPKAVASKNQALGQSGTLGEELSKTPSVKVSFNNLPLPVFINEVFSEQLGYSYVLAPGLQKQTDLVTLKLTDERSPYDLFRAARNILQDYGLSIVEDSGILRFELSTESRADGTPVLISGLALPTVPISHRPIFQIIPLSVIDPNKMRSLLNEAFRGQNIKVTMDVDSNSIILKGPIDLVTEAVEVIKVLDQPVMKGRYSISIEPAFTDAKELAQNLTNILQTEGYNTSNRPPFGAIIVLPLEGVNQIIAFANDAKTLQHVQQWAKKLDKRQPLSVEEGLFTYEVKNTQAESLVELLNQVYASGSKVSSKPSDSSPGVSKSSKDAEKGTFVLDKNRNTIIYKGSGKEWLKIEPTLQQMDKPVPSVLIEVLLAEVTLNKNTTFGVEWSTYGLSSNSSGLDNGGNLSSTAASGLTYVFTSGGATKATLNAFYNDNKVAIRSSPKLMVKSGEEARIEVGDEIPVVTGTSQGTGSGDAPINKTVQYRKTGVIMNITPIVQASGLVDLEISQELSQQSGSADAESPTILNRKVETAVTLRDGGSVLIGGLISEDRTLGETGVPFFGKLPLIGHLFKTSNDEGKKTELVMMVIPYVIRDNNEARAITESIKSTLEYTNL